jgi:acetyl esterase
MAIDPDTQAVLDLIRLAGRPPMETLSPSEARDAFNAGRAVLAPPPEDVAEVRDGTVPGPLGPIPVRLYRPLGTAESDVLPVLVYFHGGGWVVGDLNSHDVPCRRYANAVRCRVISVDYRMAPEHVFPAAVTDCAAVTQWAFDNAASLGVDPSKIAVGGDSAGGNLAAVMALMARDGALPKLAFQLLIYPATDMTMTSVSSNTIGPGVPLTSATMKWFIEHYVKGDRTDWRASPLRVASVAGTAPALVLTCTHDPLRDEGIAYAKRLELEGVRVIHLHYGDQIHGFVGMGRMIRAADQAMDIASRVMRQTLWPPGPVS